MKLPKPQLLIWPTAWALCLAAGYIMIGQWALLVLAGLAWLGWVFTAAGSPSVMLAAVVGLAAAGACAGAPAALTIAGATLALAGWDALRWESFLMEDLPAETRARLGRRHLAWLALALVPGLLAALAGRLLQIQIPFGVLVAMAALAFLGLDRVWKFGAG